MKSRGSPNRALKLTLFALLERYSTFDRLDLDEMNSKAPTPSGADDEIMHAISRVRIDGMPVVRTERTIDKGEPFHQLHLPVLGDRLPRRAEDRLPGADPAHAAAGRHAGARRRARRTHRGDVDKATIDRLAASIEILEPPEPVH